MDYFQTHRDDFEYLTVDIPSHYTVQNGAVAIETGKGRAGSSALRLNNTNQYVGFTWSINIDSSVRALLVVTPPNSGSFLGTWDIIRLVKNGTNVVFALRLRSDLNLQILGLNNAVQGLVPALLKGGVEQHLEIHWSPLGTLKVWVNEVLRFDGSGMTFNVVAVPTSLSVYFGTQSFNLNTTPVYYDDVKIWHDVPIGVQLGDNDAEHILATANGATNDYAAVGGPDHWEVVSVLDPDDAITEYEESNTPGDISLYEYIIPAYTRLLGLRMLSTSKEDSVSFDTATYRGTFRHGGGPTIVNGANHAVLGFYTRHVDEISPVPAVGGTTVEAGPELISIP